MKALEPLVEACVKASVESHGEPSPEAMKTMAQGIDALRAYARETIAKTGVPGWGDVLAHFHYVNQVQRVLETFGSEHKAIVDKLLESASAAVLLREVLDGVLEDGHKRTGKRALGEPVEEEEKEDRRHRDASIEGMRPLVECVRRGITREDIERLGQPSSGLRLNVDTFIAIRGLPTWNDLIALAARLVRVGSLHHGDPSIQQDIARAIFAFVGLMGRLESQGARLDPIPDLCSEDGHAQSSRTH